MTLAEFTINLIIGTILMRICFYFIQKYDLDGKFDRWWKSW